MDHLLSLMLFAAMMFEFVSMPQAGTATFLLLIVLGFVDTLGGLTISRSWADTYGWRSKSALNSFIASATRPLLRVTRPR